MFRSLARGLIEIHTKDRSASRPIFQLRFANRDSAKAFLAFSRSETWNPSPAFVFLAKSECPDVGECLKTSRLRSTIVDDCLW